MDEESEGFSDAGEGRLEIDDGDAATSIMATAACDTSNVVPQPGKNVKKKRPRYVYTQKQNAALVAEYGRNPVPDRKTKQSLMVNFDIPWLQVSRWFATRRMLDRRRSAKSSAHDHSTTDVDKQVHVASTPIATTTLENGTSDLGSALIDTNEQTMAGDGVGVESTFGPSDAATNLTEMMALAGVRLPIDHGYSAELQTSSAPVQHVVNTQPQTVPNATVADELPSAAATEQPQSASSDVDLSSDFLQMARHLADFFRRQELAALTAAAYSAYWRGIAEMAAAVEVIQQLPADVVQAQLPDGLSRSLVNLPQTVRTDENEIANGPSSSTVSNNSH